MKFFIQVNNDSYITDIITYQYADYKAIDLETPLPEHIMSGVYKYLGGNDIWLDEDKLKEIKRANIGESIQLRADIDYLAVMTGVDLNV